MSRNASAGIKRYQMDSGHTENKKIKLLFSEYDSDGYWIWSNLVDECYEGRGYYFDLSNEDELILFASDRCKKNLQLVRSVIDCCVRRELFDPKLAEEYNILTSDRMQEEFLFGTYSRRRKGSTVFVFREYLLIPVNDPKVVAIPLKNDFIAPGSIPKVKKDAEVKQEPEGFNDVLKKQYDGLQKSKRNILSFIEVNKPKWIDPYRDLWDIWAEENKKPVVKTINKKRLANLNARLKEKDFDFIKILTIATKSSKILEGAWFTWDWVMGSENNYVKVLEGNYNNNNEEKKQATTNEADAELKRLVEKQRTGG